LNKNEIEKNETLSSELFLMFKHLENLSDNIGYEIIDSKKTSETVYPAIKYKDMNDRIVIYGVPSGYEFGVFLESIDLIANNNITHISEELIEYFESIDESINNKLFVVPECQHSPILAKILITSSYLNRNIKTEIYQISDFPGLQKKYSIEGVPTTIINEEYAFVGMQPETKLIEIYNKIVVG
ncbi:MAG: hypothetical protein FXF54_12850, partial [Kosmotoga sp.]